MNQSLEYKEIKVGLNSLKGDQLLNIVPSPDTLMNEGIGLSDLAYYNVLMKGGRVTRNTIKKAEDPPITTLTRTKTLQPSLPKPIAAQKSEETKNSLGKIKKSSFEFRKEEHGQNLIVSFFSRTIYRFVLNFFDKV